MGGIIFLIILILFIAIIAYKSIKVVKQSEVYIIERLGKFHKVADAGLTIIFPFVDHVRSVVSLKQQTMDIPPQGVITQDNVTITIDTVVFYQITDPAKAVYEIQSLKKGIEYLAITTIRDIVGKMSLDETFSSRDLINQKLREDIKSLTNIELIEDNKVFKGIKLVTDKDTIFITICNKKDANNLAYKYWAYFCILNREEKNISLLDEIDMNSYNMAEHHDIMEISNEDKKINIKLHYIVTEDLLKKELITQDELLVLIV